MSLFKTRDWWSASVGEDEQFDHGCLCVGNIDNDPGGQDKLIIGSFHGILRIYSPHASKSESGSTGFRPEDVILEQAVQYPIIQVEIGRFASGSENLQLALLHPRKLAIYSVKAIAGNVEHGSQHQLTQLYEHSLKRSAFNMCYGTFGSVKGKDFICVQSMDGAVSIFEQESFAFTRFLPGALLPAPLKYVSRLDSFVTVSSSWQVELYKYQNLAVASDSNSREESQNIKSGKRVTYDWCFSLGEPALDIAVITFPQSPPSILILGERNLFCLTEMGKLRYMKKFEFEPSCFLPYACLTEGTINYIVATHTGSVMVYQDITLKWAAKTSHIPVQLCVASFQDLKGSIVFLSETGHLECCYLGTDPSLFTPPPVEAREINYNDFDREMASLQQEIKQNSHKAVLTPKAKVEDDLHLTVHVNHSLDDISLAAGSEVQDPDPIPSITLIVQLKSKVLIESIKTDVHVKWPLAPNQSSVTVNSLDSSKPYEIPVSVFLKGSGLPVDLEGTVTAQYQTTSGSTRICSASFRLPVKLVLKPVFPVKTAVHKLTIDTNKEPANLNDLYPDLLGDNAGGQGSALGFQFYGGPVITILASKTSQRYRIQCDRLEAMWLPLRELANRLTNHYNKTGDFSVYYTGTLPLQEYFELIDAHFEYRMNAFNCRDMLNQRSSQFRAIQRRLLTKFKDKTPSSINNLDTLLEGTYRQIIALADAVDENARSMGEASNNLGSGTRLLNYLIKLWINMNDEEYKMLNSAVSPVVIDSEEQGWEEAVDAAITHLLRTVLAKTVKDQTVNPAPLSIPQDTTKVKKHIALLCDKLGKGSRLVDGVTGGNPPMRREKKDKIKVSSTNKNVVENGDMFSDRSSSFSSSDDTETLIGSRFGESKSKKKDKELFYGAKLDSLAPLVEPVVDVSDANTERSKKNIDHMVPDLDDMQTFEGPNLINGESEEPFSY